MIHVEMEYGELPRAHENKYMDWSSRKIAHGVIGIMWGKGKPAYGNKLYSIVTYRRLDIRTRRDVTVIVKNAIIPPLEYAGDVWEGTKK